MKENIMDKNVSFEAKDPSLGYYYQVLYSLYLMLVRRDIPNLTMKLEGLDDLEIICSGNLHLIQLKHHNTDGNSLSDRSLDFWKTIRVWSTEIAQDKIREINNTIFSLVTTGKISDNSFLLKLKDGKSRDAEYALKEMIKISANQSVKSTEKSYKAFSDLSYTQKKLLINNVYIIDQEVDIVAVEELIKSQLKYSASPDKVSALFEGVIGWWLMQCIDLLSDSDKSEIKDGDLQNKIWEIIETLKQDNLPDSFVLSSIENPLNEFENHIFFKQLKLIALGNRSLLKAINDFRKAYGQKNKWLQDGLILPDEIEKYEQNLYDNWNRLFSKVADKYDGSKNSEELMLAGQDFYNEFIGKTHPNIRPNYSSTYYPIGSYHMLADEKQIGWNPDYENLI